MKRIALLTASLLIFCACAAPPAGLAPSSEGASSAGAIQAYSSSGSEASAQSGASQAIDTQVLTEAQAHEMLKDDRGPEQYSDQLNYVLSHKDGATSNITPLTDWVEHYQKGEPAEAAILYYGWTAPSIYVLTSNGTQEYTITEYTTFRPTAQYKSSVVTERQIDYTFGGDVDIKQMPLTVRKEYDTEKYSHEHRYENTAETYAPANLRSYIFGSCVYRPGSPGYILIPAEVPGNITLRDCFTDIEEYLAVKLDISRIVQDGDLVYINFEPGSMPTVGFSKPLEEAVLYSLACTVMKNHQGTLGVCFEINGEPYSSENLHFKSNSICLLPDAPTVGKLSAEEAGEIARKKLHAYYQSLYGSAAKSTEDYIFSPLYAEYVNGVLCYVLNYYDNKDAYKKGLDAGTIVLDADQGSLLFEVSMVDGSYVLVSDDNEKRILPQGITSPAPAVNPQPITEARAHEIAADWENFDTYSELYGYPLTSYNHYTKNSGQLLNWIESYRLGRPCEAVLLYYGSPLSGVLKLTCDGTPEYTITLYGAETTQEAKSSMVTERITDYTFGADIDGKGWPLPIKKEGVEALHENAERYNDVPRQSPTAAPNSDTPRIFIHDANTQQYHIQPSTQDRITNLINYFVDIENAFGRPLFIEPDVLMPDGVLYVNFTEKLSDRNFSPQTEQAILFSIARTIMENEPQVKGVCFEADKKPYHVSALGISYGNNEMCMPPEAPPLGKLSLKQAETIARAKVAEIFPERNSEWKEFDPSAFVLKLYAAKYIEGNLCYLYRLYENDQRLIQGQYAGTVALDVEGGNFLYTIGMEDGANILLYDANEKQFVPQP